MNLCFIVAGFEPGKDGVGDYTRRLAAWLETHGITTAVIAWNDGWVDAVHESNTVLRLGQKIPEVEKISRAKSFLLSTKSTAVSIQWVPHGYHGKGLFTRQVDSLKQVIGNLSAQIMIHEIWLGAKVESTLKEQLYGWLQRRAFRHLFQSIQPLFIHTQCRAYQYLLQNEFKRDIGILPLFGNIPVQPLTRSQDTCIRAGFFGSIHLETSIDGFMVSFLELGEKTNRPLQIEHAGRASEAGISLFEQWHSQWGDRVLFKRHGDLSEFALSDYFHQLDFGLSSNPLCLTDKSGSVAAMLEHNIPVINLRNDVTFKGYRPQFDPNTILVDFDADHLNKCLGIGIPVLSKPSLDMTGNLFLKAVKRMI